MLFSCFRSKGGWNNNPNCLQLKYALRKMLLRNAITASKNANCLTFETIPTSIIPFFHTKKHKAPLTEATTDDNEPQISLEENYLGTQLNSPETTEFVCNILFYIGGYLASKLVRKLTCLSCKICLVSQFHGPTPDHDYCAMRYSEITSAAAFTCVIMTQNLNNERDIDFEDARGKIDSESFSSSGASDDEVLEYSVPEEIMGLQHGFESRLENLDW